MQPPSTSLLRTEPQRMSQKGFRQRNEPVQTLATYRPDHPFAEAVRHWTARRRFQNTQPQAADRGVELPREDAVAVMKQITVVGVKSERLAQLLARPGRCRVRRHARLGDFPIHVAAQIGGNTAQLHVQPVAGAAAGQTEDKFNPRLFQRMMLSNDAAAMPL